MNSTIAFVRMLLSAQLLVTGFLALLLWSLHAPLRRQEFNRWWASAWTLTALFLALGWQALALPAGVTVTKVVVVFLATLLGFLVAPALIFGAMTFRSPGTVSRRLALSGLGAAAAIGTLVFAASYYASARGLSGFAVRNGSRTLVLAAALTVCAWVFLQHFRAKRSRAALVTSFSCFLYAVDQSIFSAALLSRVVDTDSLLYRNTASLLYLDVALTFGICLGMALLLLEDYQRSERALAASIDHERQVTDENSALQREIRNREETERKLRVSEDRYRDLVEHSEDLVCTHDLEGRILSCNPAPARILGYDVHEIIAMSARDLLAPDVRGDFDEYLRIIQRDGVASGVMKVVTRSGERRMWSYRNTLRTDGVTAPIVRGMAHDVTEQHRAEKALRQSEQKFAAVFRSSPCGMALLSGDGSILDVNAAFESQTGYGRNELLDRTLLDTGTWVDPEARRVFRAALARDGRIEASEVRLRHRNGNVLTVVFSAETVQVGSERCVLLAGLDVTARREAETREHRADQRARVLQEELAHAGRVLALGTLTGSLAHEINQPLTAVRVNAHAALNLLSVNPPAIDAVREALNDIKHDNQRIDDVLRRLRLLLRKEPREYARLDVNALVDDVMKLVRSNFIERRITTDVVLAPNIPAVVGDRVQLQQVILNILMNAADAVTAAYDADSPPVTVTTTFDGAQVRVSVTDQGAGAPDGDLDRMFEPFFTTKADGMGLGLSICRAIMDAHGGHISARRNAPPDRGLTCWFALDAAVAGRQDSPLRGNAARGNQVAT